MSDVTRLLQEIGHGDARATEALMALVYDELRRLAQARMSQERADHTLQATALVHEAYLRLLGDDGQQWSSRGHFFAAAAEAMRRILVESARRKASLKRGGDRQRIELDSNCGGSESSDLDVLALDEALTKLSVTDPAKAKVVKLRYFAGLTMTEVADALGISRATAERHWTFARSWLYAELNDEGKRRP